MTKVHVSLSARAFVTGHAEVEVEDPDNEEEVLAAVHKNGIGNILWEYQGIDDTTEDCIDVSDVEVLEGDEEKPQWEHDCDNCVFLGRHDDVDLYFCDGDAISRTLIARHSDRVDDYGSGLPFISSMPLITEAARRAVARGLLHKHTPTGKAGGETVEQAIATAVEP